MGLPRIDLPLFELTIPSTNKKVKFRPFTVKEEKILLIAQESNDSKQIVLAIKQILNNCLQGIDVNTLATFDLQYILLNIRAKSVNNEVTFNIKDPDTNETVELVIDINDIEIKRSPEHSKVIKITDTIALQMRYPTIEYIEDLDSEEGKSTDDLYKIMVECIESVVDGDQVYKLKDFTQQEVTDFLDSLTADVAMRIKKFFDTMPVMRYEKKYKNKNGVEKTFVAEGMETFFI
jgi:T4 bacteriophage base plate protein